VGRLGREREVERWRGGDGEGDGGKEGGRRFID